MLLGLLIIGLAGFALIVLVLAHMTIVTPCPDCDEGEVEFEPPRIRTCDTCGSAFLCEQDGALVPVDTEAA
jgi:ribosomal protein L37AE/L43A